MHRNGFTLWIVLWIVSSFAVFSIPCAGQTQKPADPKADGDSREVTVFSLKYVKAEAAAEVLEALFNGNAKLRISVDIRQNAIIVAGSREETKRVEVALKVIDKNEPNHSSNEKRIKVFPLQNMSAENALHTIQILYPDTNLQLAVIEQSNKLVALGIKSELEFVEALLQNLDEEQSPRDKFQTDFLSLPKDEGLLKDGGQFIDRIAKSNDVEIAIQEGLGLVMLKGSQDSVKKTLSTIELVRQIHAAKGNPTTDSKSSVGAEKMLRVVWLTDKPFGKAWSSPDAVLRPVVDKLATMGFQDVGVAGQVLARCKLSEGPTDFSVKGRIAEAELDVEGSLGFSAAATDRLDAKVKISVSISDSGRVTAQSPAASVGVVVQLVENKPVVLASTPMNDMQSFFVVQLLSGE